jgi:ectoine hydroxylase-related dioxygenase (phytanoyl-CoA dioxygenase family)
MVLQVVKGSHRTELRELHSDKNVQNVLGSATHRDDEIDPADIVHLELEAGDVSIHHPNIIHASDPNTSEHRRCGLTIRYMATTTECLQKEQPVMVMAGDKVC